MKRKVGTSMATEAFTTQKMAATLGKSKSRKKGRFSAALVLLIAYTVSLEQLAQIIFQMSRIRFPCMEQQMVVKRGIPFPTKALT
jgi:hypothetical protein